ncbi:putative tubulin polyglutamylase TTLL13 [Paratrimastix pyriformis]|uniref:Tubulin polyglutamylase TTLL13 n=1 Tax=Paratrimastix pyriformis TaxID=342808 RepID=A0ABQ8UFA4_9EUKA|nr:putative tubulin polyglutamylase TTLL13 [Paratrimastix pyriformis]
MHTINLHHCEGGNSGAVTCAVAKLGWNVSPKNDFSFRVCWWDAFEEIPPDFLEQMSPPQLVSRFVGTSFLSDQAHLYGLIKMASLFEPSDSYNFVPPAWIFPQDSDAILKKSVGIRKKGGSRRTYLLREPHRSTALVQAPFSLPTGTSGQFVLQRYVDRPLLLGGHKFELRLFGLLTSLSPPTAFLYKDGLVCLCPRPYVAPSAGSMHLLEAQMCSPSSCRLCPEYNGREHCRTLVSLLQDDLPPRSWGRRPRLWAALRVIVARTFGLFAPHLGPCYQAATRGATAAQGAASPAGGGDAPSSAPSRCFQIFEFRVLLDEGARPWLVDVSPSPSWELNPDMPALRAVLVGLVQETLRVVTSPERALPGRLCGYEPLPLAPGPPTCAAPGPPTGTGVLWDGRLLGLFSRYTAIRTPRWVTSQGFRRMAEDVGLFSEVDGPRSHLAEAFFGRAMRGTSLGEDGCPPGAMTFPVWLEALGRLAAERVQQQQEPGGAGAGAGAEGAGCEEACREMLYRMLHLDPPAPG